MVVITDVKTRVCSLCHTEKPLEEFNKNRTMALGRYYWCKVCSRRVDRERDRIRDKTPERIEKSKRWLKSKRGRELYLQRRYRYPEKLIARQETRKLIKKGIVLQLPCLVCGDLMSAAHHPDYSRPDYVIWLCRKHHALLHRKD